jgi:CheY-like chemotaxis protein
MLCLATRMPSFVSGAPASTAADPAHVLLVEDDPDNNDMYATALRGAGFRVTQVHDGLQAWHQVLSQPPHVLVTDLAIPGIDGFELCRRLRSIERTAGLPMITVTGLARDTDVQQAQGAGFDAVLLKPCDPSTLLAEVHRTLAHSAELKMRSQVQRRRVAELRQQVTVTLDRSDATTVRERTPQRIDALQRIRGEYTEMPGLTLTIAQASRLWCVDPALCRDLLERLVADGFLKRHNGSYSRS